MNSSFCIPVPYDEKDIVFGISSGRYGRSSWKHSTSNFFSITDWGIDLDYSDVEWFILEVNRDHHVIFEISPKYCISDSFVDCEDYSISSQGFLSTVDIMVI